MDNGGVAGSSSHNEISSPGPAIHKDEVIKMTLAGPGSTTDVLRSGGIDSGALVAALGRKLGIPTGTDQLVTAAQWSRATHVSHRQTPS